MGYEDFKNIIKEVAKESGYTVNEFGNNRFEIVVANTWHCSVFQVKESVKYLEVQPWEASENESNTGGKWGRAIYSLRSISDVIQFCSILMNSYALRAKRGG